MSVLNCMVRPFRTPKRTVRSPALAFGSHCSVFKERRDTRLSGQGWCRPRLRARAGRCEHVLPGFTIIATPLPLSSWALEPPAFLPARRLYTLSHPPPAGAGPQSKQGRAPARGNSPALDVDHGPSSVVRRPSSVVRRPSSTDPGPWTVDRNDLAGNQVLRLPPGTAAAWYGCRLASQAPADPTRLAHASAPAALSRRRAAPVTGGDRPVPTTATSGRWPS